MKIPNFPTGKIITKDGNLTDNWSKALVQLFQELQKNMSNEGHIVPSQSASNLLVLDNDTNRKGALIYDGDNDKLKVNIAGVLKEIQTV